MSEIPEVVHLACRDLFFATKIEATVRQLGMSLVRVETAGDLEDASLLIVDLDAPVAGPIALIREARERSASLRIVAFVRHDRSERIREAREAGVTQVLSRGAFSERLPALIQKQS